MTCSIDTLVDGLFGAAFTEVLQAMASEANMNLDATMHVEHHDMLQCTNANSKYIYIHTYIHITYVIIIRFDSLDLTTCLTVAWCYHG